MKNITKEFLEKKFKEYYSTYGKTADYIFVFSQEQKDIRKESAIDDLFHAPFNDGKDCYIHGTMYSEMMHRDCGRIDKDGWDDVEFICVGRSEDITRK